MDNDGLKDLFIANGIYRDLTDQDYLQYVSSDEVINSIVTNNQVDYARLIDIIPSNPIENQAYKNLGDLKFNRDAALGLETKGFSNGAAYGDLDNDGDLDLVVNNVNMPLFVYKNTSENKTNNNFIQFNLKGTGKNTFAVGTLIEVSQGDNTYSVAQQPIRGFQSSMDQRPHIGLPSDNSVQVKVTWPNGMVTIKDEVQTNQLLQLEMLDGVVNTNLSEAPDAIIFSEINAVDAYVHQENNFIDFNRDRLLHHMMSTPGPKSAIGDLNNDGIQDVIIGGSKGFRSEVLLGDQQGQYKHSKEFNFSEDLAAEVTAVALLDADGDGDLDIYMGNGGIEFSKFSSELADQLYLNNGDGIFSPSPNVLPTASSYFNTSVVSTGDFDQDGDTDLFVGERSITAAYGVPVNGHLLRNDGTGIFADQTAILAPGLNEIGMITDANFNDIDADGDLDLVVIGEFMGIEIFLNDQGSFTKKASELQQEKGWWSALKIADVNQDGFPDLIVGNHGENSRFKASKEQPICLFVQDFDQNGALDPVMGFTATDGKVYPYNLRHNLIDQMKGLKKKFPDYNSFKNADLNTIFSEEALNLSTKATAVELKTSIYINDGNGGFTSIPLPKQVQMSPIFAIETGDFDLDGDIDIVLAGNLFRVKPEVGRYDASFGTFLENTGNDTIGTPIFKVTPGNKGLKVTGEVRSIQKTNNTLLFVRNSDAILRYKF
jgi:hypothetical protein